MKRLSPWWLVVALLAAGVGTVAAGDPPAGDDHGKKADEARPAAPAKPPSPQAIVAAKVAFGDVARVLMSPRCSNCHPRGDRPLQTDAARPHRMNVSRTSAESGLACSTCHQEHNSEVVGVAGGPPGAPHWGLPPKEFPMPFREHTPRSLCEQLKDPRRNGERSLADLLHHVQHDPLVLWGWNPGGNRSKPPLSHADFVAAFRRWVDGGGACPDEAK